MLAGFDILFRFRAAGLLEHRIQIILSDMALKRSTGFGLSTLLFKFATVTCARGGQRGRVFIIDRFRNSVKNEDLTPMFCVTPMFCEIRKARGAKKPEADVKYPRVVEAVGPAPEQYPS